MSFRKFPPLLLAAALVLPVADSVADDDNWPCTVALCMANPKGSTNEPKCRPPMRKLFRALHLGQPFPHCKMSDDSANKAEATTQRFTSKNCPRQYRYAGGHLGTTMECLYDGAITYRLDENTRVRLLWNEAGESITETLHDASQDDDLDEPRRPGEQLR